MPVTESKLRTGVLTIGGTDYAAQATSVQVRPAHDTTGDPLELLDGSVLPASTTRTDTLVITAVQDFTDPAGLLAYTWAHDLQAVPFTWSPRGATGESFTGTVEVRALPVGGEVNRRLTADAEWTCVGPVTWSPAGG
jgi:hypothetical protein